MGQLGRVWQDFPESNKPWMQPQAAHFLPADSSWKDRGSMVLAAEESAYAIALQSEAKAIEREMENQLNDMQHDWRRMDSSHWWE
jgi:hypothetical protein